MKAMILAAGLGTRLKPWTDLHPKALVPLAGKPMLLHAIERLLPLEPSAIVINIHHHAQQVADYIAGIHNLPCPVILSDESDMLLDTGGALLKASPLLEGDEPVVVTNADIYLDLDLAPMLKAHRRGGSLATLLVSGRKSSRQLGIDSLGYLKAWRNNNTGATIPPNLDGIETNGKDNTLQWVSFNGVHIISPELLHDMTSRRTPSTPFPIIPYYLEACMQGLSISTFMPTAPYQWFDIGTPEKLSQAQEALTNQL